MPYSPESKNVIIMEDTPGVKFVLEAAVKSLGFSPNSSESREEFLEIYRSGISYFAIILDNQVPYDKGSNIPKKDIGIGIAPQLLKRESGLRVAIHTGDDMKERLSEFERIGLFYMQKPASLETLGKFLGILC